MQVREMLRPPSAQIVFGDASPHVTVSDPHVVTIPTEGANRFIHKLTNYRECAQVGSAMFGGAASHHKKYHDSEKNNLGYSVSH